MIETVSETTIAQGLRFLSARDAGLSRLIEEYGAPPLWARPAGFPTLIHIILEQQVSLASARAAYVRLLAASSPLTPGRFLTLDDASLKAIGFSRQKINYSRGLAESILAGRLDLPALESLPDAEARAALTAIKGIGQWTADIYLLMALLRRDVLPCGDLALAVAVQRLEALAARPSPNELEAIGARWRPWRAVAARVLWHYYLNRQARAKTSPPHASRG